MKPMIEEEVGSLLLCFSIASSACPSSHEPLVSWRPCSCLFDSICSSSTIASQEEEDDIPEGACLVPSAGTQLENSAAELRRLCRLAGIFRACRSALANISTEVSRVDGFGTAAFLHKH